MTRTTLIAAVIVVAGAFARGAAAAEEATATVTIAGVHYTLPDSHEAGDVVRVEYEPSNPFCYVDQYRYMRIVDRELFINGGMMYAARPGDNVVVTEGPGGTFHGSIIHVNGRLVTPPEPPMLRSFDHPCESANKISRIVRRTPAK